MRARRMKQKPVTDLCRNQPCYVRLDGCNSTPENSSPAHLRLPGITGMSYIAPEFMVCPACPSCHDIVDRRRITEMPRDYVLKAHYEGIFRWQMELYKREILLVMP